jgi:hypothetical protein
MSPFFFIASFPHRDNANSRASSRPNDRYYFTIKFADAEPALLVAARRWSSADRTPVKQPATIEKIEPASIQDQKTLGFRLFELHSAICTLMWSLFEKLPASFFADDALRPAARRGREYKQPLSADSPFAASAANQQREIPCWLY